MDTQQKRPVTLKVAMALLILRLGLIVLLIGTYALVKDATPADGPVVNGIKKGFHNAFGFSDVYTYANLWYMIGLVSLPVVLIIFTMIFLYHRKFVVTVVFASLNLASDIANGMPFIAIAVLILIVTNPGQKYLRRKQDPPPPYPTNWPPQPPEGENR